MVDLGHRQTQLTTSATTKQYVQTISISGVSFPTSQNALVLLIALHQFVLLNTFLPPLLLPLHQNLPFCDRRRLADLFLLHGQHNIAQQKHHGDGLAYILACNMFCGVLMTLFILTNIHKPYIDAARDAKITFYLRVETACTAFS